MIEARFASIRSASALTEDAGIIEPCRLHALALVEQLRTVLTVIDRFDKEIERVASALQDYALFRSLPAQARIWRHAYSQPSESNVSVSMARTSCKSTPALPR